MGFIYCQWHRFVGRYLNYNLTHSPLDKMTAISQFVPYGSINIEPVLVPVMAWRQPGDKPLHEPMLTQFTDACMWH